MVICFHTTKTDLQGQKSDIFHQCYDYNAKLKNIMIFFQTQLCVSIIYGLITLYKSVFDSFMLHSESSQER